MSSCLHLLAEDQELEFSSQVYIQLDDLETSISNDKLKPLEKPRHKSLKECLQPEISLNYGFPALALSFAAAEVQ